MKVIFPHANNYEISQALFIGAWKVWFKRFSEKGAYWRGALMPTGANEQSLSALLQEGRRFSCEVVCRMLVPWPYRDQLQFDAEFLKANPQLVEPIEERNLEGGLEQGYRLSALALEFWDNLSFHGQEQMLNRAEARIQADIETPNDEPVVIDDSGIVLIGEDIYPPVIPEKYDDESQFVRALVEWIEDDMYQPMYCRRPVGDSVQGWDQRIYAYFWPKPRVTWAHNCITHEPILFRAQRLAETIQDSGSWNDFERAVAVKVATEVFNIVGSPQPKPSWQQVFDVFSAALAADENAKAQLNSGWTYLAATATQHLEDGGLPIVAWDSRISTAIISRLDFLMVEAGLSKPEELFAGIGLVPGTGGTRPRELSLNWPNAYRRWDCLIAASRLVIKIRDVLNSELRNDGGLRYPRMPVPGGGTGDWTVRGVQRVLFCDGY